jgi:hypothetical protein
MSDMGCCGYLLHGLCGLSGIVGAFTSAQDWWRRQKLVETPLGAGKGWCFVAIPTRSPRMDATVQICKNSKRGWILRDSLGLVYRSFTSFFP